MQYPNGYAQSNYNEYGRAPQTQAYQTQQHPMVVIPSHQPSQPTPHLYYSQPPRPPPQSQIHAQPQQTAFYQQYPSQYAASAQQQHYPQSQQQQFYSQPTPLVQQHSIASNGANSTQVSYNAAPSQQQFQPSGTLDPRGIFPPEPAPRRVSQPRAQPRHEQTVHQQNPGLSHLPVSPDPLQAYLPPPHPRMEVASSQRQDQPSPPQSQQRCSQTQRPSAEMHRSPGMPKPRVFARVEILAHQANVASSESNHLRPQKRHKSNEGHSLPASISEPSLPPTASKNVSRPTVGPQSPPTSSLTDLASSQMPRTPQPNVDYQTLLLALADEYITAAYSMSASLVISPSSGDLQEHYNSLVSTAMGCLESVLDHYRQSDSRTEARLRLRLATLMVEETENDEEAEIVLGKGIALCERSRLSDLKYAMHHLLIRLSFKKSPKAALKAIDRVVQEVEALRLSHWAYCFRFLRVSLNLQASLRTETHAAFKHLAAISSTAEEQRDTAVQIVAAVFEGILHIQSGTEDAAELAQRAFATARTHQLSDEMTQMPQISALLDCLDLSCCLMVFQFDQIDNKLQHMEKNLDSLTHHPCWNKDGSINVKLAIPAGDELERDTCGVFGKSKDGHTSLTFQWATKSQVYIFGYALSGYARLCKNAESTKAEAYFKEGLKLCRQQVPSTIPRSLHDAVEDLTQRHSMSVAIDLHIVFALCARFDWGVAHKALRDVQTEIKRDGLIIDEIMRRTMLYLQALCSHGLGKLREALVLYESAELTFEADTKMTCHERDIRMLAALNNIFISRTLGVEDHAKAEKFLSAIEPYASRHANHSIRAAYLIIRATTQSQPPNNAIMKRKQYLQTAINAARAAWSSQLLSVVMNIMTGTMFTNIVGEQAEKSARAGVSLAKKARHPLWIVVANGMCGDIMERCGKPDDAQAARKEAQVLSAALPESLKQSMHGSAGQM